MQRFNSFARVGRSSLTSTAGRPSTTAPRLMLVRTKIDKTSIGNDKDAAMDKSQADAKYSQGSNDKETVAEKHSLDRSKDDAKRFQDAHTEEMTKAREERGGSGQTESGTTSSANKLSHGTNSGKAEEQRKHHATAEGSEFQPGQKGDQVAGAASEKDGQQPGEGMGGTKEPASSGTLSGVKDFAANLVNKGPASRSFSTFARMRFPAVPESAVDKGARDSKDTTVKGEQTEHLPHHAQGQDDKMPAVKNNASLPSKQGKAGSPKSFSTSAFRSALNQGTGPSQDARPTGTANSPGSRAVDPSSGTHSPSFSPKTGPTATYTHVIGTPEPDSHQTAYQYSTTSESGHLPSGTASRSSTSTSEYPKHAATDDILKNEAGVGSSNDKIDQSLRGADEMVAKQEVGQAGDDAGGRQQQPGGRAYTVPPDVGEIEQDTLPKPIKA